MKLLDHIRVLDLTNVLSGPFATLHLSLLGAEVIKVENPVDGDLARKLGNVPELNEQLMGTSFLAQNANGADRAAWSDAEVESRSQARHDFRVGWQREQTLRRKVVNTLDLDLTIDQALTV